MPLNMKRNLSIISVLRILFIYGIVFYHINQFFYVSDIFSVLGIGTYGCVVISGFLAGYLHGTEYNDYRISDSIRMWYSKIKKFYFVHFILFCTCIPLVIYNYHLFGTSLDRILTDVLSGIVNLMLLQCFVPNESVYFSYNGVSWYLSMTLVLYFLTPFFIHFLNKRGLPEKKINFCCYIVILIYSIKVILSGFIPDISLDYILPISHIPGFVIAITMGMFYSQNISLTKIHWSKNLIIILIAFIVRYLSIAFMIANGNFAVDGVGIEFAFSLLLLVAIQIPCKNNRIINILSTTSFEVFMVHQVVCRYFNIIYFKVMNCGNTAAFLCIVSITMVSSYFLHQLSYLIHNLKTDKSTT